MPLLFHKENLNREYFCILCFRGKKRKKKTGLDLNDTSNICDLSIKISLKVVLQYDNCIEINVQVTTTRLSSSNHHYTKHVLFWYSAYLLLLLSCEHRAWLTKPIRQHHSTRGQTILQSVADLIRGTQPIDQSKHNHQGHSSSQAFKE